MPPPSDLDINRGVRRVLVKHWVDLGRLSVRSTQGAVMLYGVLQRVSGRNDDLTPRIVDTIFQEIKRVRGVTRITAHFENWKVESGAWQPISRAADTGILRYRPINSAAHDTS